MRLEFYFVLSSVTRKYDLNNDGWNVRFGSKADMCGAKRHVRFTPNSDIDCVFGVSTLGQKRTFSARN